MNKKVSTILTCGLMLGGSLLSSSAFAETFPLADKALESVANGDEVVFYQKGQAETERILGVAVDKKGNKSIDVIDATAKNFKKADINNYKWQVVVGQSTTKKTIYSFVNVATKDTLAFDNQDKPIFTDKDAKVYATHDGKYQFYYTDGQINYDGTDQHRFLSATDFDAAGNAKKAIYLEQNSARLEGTDYSNIETYLYDTTPDAVDDEELNAFFNTKGFNLEVNGEEVQGNLFGGDSRVWAFQVNKKACADATNNWDKDKGYKVSEDGANGKDLYIPEGIYFFTDRVLNDDCDPSEGITAEDIDWLESTFIAVSVKETVENTVPDRGNGQGFKLM